MVDCNRICIPLFVSTSRSIHHSWLINGFLTRVNRSLNCLREHTSPTHGLRAVHAVPSLVFCVVFCRLLFVLLTFFVWSLCCLFFFDWRIMITPFDIFKLFVSFKNFFRRYQHLVGKYSVTCIQMTKNVLAIILWFGVDYYITLMSYDGLCMLFNN